MSRIVENTNKPSEVTEVVCLDELGAGGMAHKYSIVAKEADFEKGGQQEFASINFQKGAIQENDVNGCHNEDLILVVLDRLRGAQAGDFSCRENAIAITKLEEALLWLNYRTNARTARGVEDTSQK